MNFKLLSILLFFSTLCYGQDFGKSCNEYVHDFSAQISFYDLDSLSAPHDTVILQAVSGLAGEDAVLFILSETSDSVCNSITETAPQTLALLEGKQDMNSRFVLRDVLKQFIENEEELKENKERQTNEGVGLKGNFIAALIAERLMERACQIPPPPDPKVAMKRMVSMALAALLGGLIPTVMVFVKGRRRKEEVA